MVKGHKTKKNPLKSGMALLLTFTLLMNPLAAFAAKGDGSEESDDSDEAGVCAQPTLDSSTKAGSDLSSDVDAALCKQSPVDLSDQEEAEADLFAFIKDEIFDEFRKDALDRERMAYWLALRKADGVRENPSCLSDEELGRLADVQLNIDIEKQKNLKIHHDKFHQDMKEQRARNKNPDGPNLIQLQVSDETINVSVREGVEKINGEGEPAINAVLNQIDQIMGGKLPETEDDFNQFVGQIRAMEIDPKVVVSDQAMGAIKHHAPVGMLLHNFADLRLPKEIEENFDKNKDPKKDLTAFAHLYYIVSKYQALSPFVKGENRFDLTELFQTRGSDLLNRDCKKIKSSLNNILNYKLHLPLDSFSKDEIPKFSGTFVRQAQELLIQKAIDGISDSAVEDEKVRKINAKFEKYAQTHLCDQSDLTPLTGQENDFLDMIKETVTPGKKKNRSSNEDRVKDALGLKNMTPSQLSQLKNGGAIDGSGNLNLSSLNLTGGVGPVINPGFMASGSQAKEPAGRSSQTSGGSSGTGGGTAGMSALAGMTSLAPSSSGVPSSTSRSGGIIEDQSKKKRRGSDPSPQVKPAVPNKKNPSASPSSNTGTGSSLDIPSGVPRDSAATTASRTIRSRSATSLTKPKIQRRKSTSDVPSKAVKTQTQGGLTSDPTSDSAAASFRTPSTLPAGTQRVNSQSGSSFASVPQTPEVDEQQAKQEIIQPKTYEETGDLKEPSAKSSDQQQVKISDKSKKDEDTEKEKISKVSDVPPSIAGINLKQIDATPTVEFTQKIFDDMVKDCKDGDKGQVCQELDVYLRSFMDNSKKAVVQINENKEKMLVQISDKGLEIYKIIRMGDDQVKYEPYKSAKTKKFKQKMVQKVIRQKREAPKQFGDGASSSDQQQKYKYEQLLKTLEVH